MKARALGRFVAEFLEGFAGSDEPAAAAPSMPSVIPMDAIRQAVREVIEPLIAEDGTPPDPGAGQAPDAHEAPPSAEQLDLLFADAGRNGQASADTSETMLRRVHEERLRAIQEREAERERAEQQGGEQPQFYDPDLPGQKPWTAPQTERA